MQDLLADETKRKACGMTQRMLRALQCAPVDRPPVWLMRQAGRCLPEYRALKEKYSFQQLLRNPDLAAEVTLQPVRRFKFDAAIIFSDILVVPEALGQGFSFRDTGGVEMDYVVRDRNDLRRLNTSGITDRLQYVAAAIQCVKSELDPGTALLGFAGSPWTLASFMLEGGSARAQTKALQLFRRDRALFDSLLEELTLAVIEFLQMQIAAGVDAIQIFDSLGGLLPVEDFEAASGQWMHTIISALEGKVPVIVYSKGARDWKSLVQTGAQAIGIDHEIDLGEAVQKVPASVAVQGNLAPELLAGADPRLVAAETSRLLELMRGRDGYIFNLGHGVPADAKMENLEALVGTVQNFS
ncbi:MAG: uroporphyrinogen decarboxylase [Limisphaerales bacterium]